MYEHGGCEEMIEKDREVQIHSFDDVQRVLANEEKFKIKLGIGRKAFTSLRAMNIASKIGTTGAVAGAGFGVTSLALTPKGLSGLLVATGLTSNPIGWVAVATAAGAAAVYFGASHLFKIYSTSRVDEVPRFLNTGLL